jgi:hypothetical protein
MPIHGNSAAGLRRNRAWLGCATVAAAVALTSCAHPTRVVVSVQMLEETDASMPRWIERAIVRKPAAIASLLTPLCSRLALLVVRTPEQWRLLQAAAPEFGDCPDLDRGAFVGIVSRAGQPLDGRWPVTLEAVRVCEGAGYVTANFESGTYLPDGTTYVEAAQVDGLLAILLVDVNGVRFYP